MFQNKQEKTRLVIDLYQNQSKTYRQIAEEVRISPNYTTYSKVIHVGKEGCGIEEIVRYLQLSNQEILLDYHSLKNIINGG